MLGESLSSWRQRVGIANGYHLFPLFGELRRIDHDWGAHDSAMLCLKEASHLTTERLSSMSLFSMEGRVFTRTLGRSHPPWVLQPGYTRSGPAAGPVYCPQCLSDDDQPFFRLIWRLGIVTSCPVHGCEIMDACWHCSAKIWPHGAAVGRLFAADAIPLQECPYCRADLRAVTPLRMDSMISRQLISASVFTSIRIGANLTVPCHEYFRGLSAICHLFLRRRPNRALQRGHHEWRKLARSHAGTALNRVELLRVAARRELLEVAVEVLQDWPDRFLRFAHATSIQREHFSGSDGLQPPWMSEAIDAHLRRQQRWVRTSDVAAAMTSLRAAGQPITRAAVRRALGVVDARAVEQGMAWRRLATEAELRELLACLDAETGHVTYRRSSMYVQLRDALVLVLAMLTGKPYEEIGAYDNQQVLAAVESAPLTELGAAIQTRARSWTEQLTRLRKSLCAEAGSHTLLISVKAKGTWDAGRRSGSLLRQLMQPADPLLIRSVTVFSPLLQAPSIHEPAESAG